MIEHKIINSNESGLSVRIKLNDMLRNLISGSEGVNKLWQRLVEVNNAVISNEETLASSQEAFETSIRDIMGYTDREVADILSYVNGMEGGVSGFAETPNYNPSFPEGVAATVIGVGPGTFTHFLDEGGNPITIDSVSIVIFYKAAGSNYWRYNTVLPTVVANEVANEFGDSTVKVISQKLFTDSLSGRVSDCITLSNVSELDNYGDIEKCGLYVIKRGSTFAGNMVVSANWDSQLVFQFLFGGFEVSNGSLVVSEKGSIVYRFKNISSATSDISRGSWSEWKSSQDSSYRKITYAALVTLVEEGKLVPGCRYAITDYKCVWSYRLETDGTMYHGYDEASDFTYIVCTAISESSLDENVSVVRSPTKIPIIECKYTIDNDRFTWTRIIEEGDPYYGKATGAIFYMEDANHNICDYDFKHVKFRRYAITNVEANMVADTNSDETGTSPFRITKTTSSRCPSDDRCLLGCNDPIEEPLAKAIFEGTWRCGNEENPRFPDLKTSPVLNSPLQPFHQDYINYCVKPYQNADRPDAKYLAWCVGMSNTSNGLGYGRMASWIGHSAKITVDPNDYVDCYTFDCGGQDMSDIRMDLPSKPGVKWSFCNNNRITARERFSAGRRTSTTLPNIVIKLAKYCLDNQAAKCTISNNVIEGMQCWRNTIMISPIPGIAPQLLGNKIDYSFVGNLIVATGYIYNCEFRYFAHNYFIGSMYTSKINVCTDNTLFGLFTGMQMDKTFNYNLWYGCSMRVKYEGGTSWVSPTDGQYTYDTRIRGFCMGNIFSPMQYATFEDHTDSNTFRSVYNKDFEADGLIMCSVGNIRYGTKIFYKMCGIYLNEVDNCLIYGESFKNSDIMWPNKIWVMNPKIIEAGFPKRLAGVEIEATNGDASTVLNCLGNVEMTRPAGSRFKLLYNADKVGTKEEWELVSHSEENKKLKELVVALTEEEYNALGEKNENTLYCIYEE